MCWERERGVCERRGSQIDCGTVDLQPQHAEMRAMEDKELTAVGRICKQVLVQVVSLVAERPHAVLTVIPHFTRIIYETVKVPI